MKNGCSLVQALLALKGEKSDRSDKKKDVYEQLEETLLPFLILHNCSKIITWQTEPQLTERLIKKIKVLDVRKMKKI